ncbi:MAG: hypothetical protein MK052_10120 [Alphaproteobacteria bacterium]|nr:hypothetical protein [Alphaproteobacteria bacterium]
MRAPETNNTGRDLGATAAAVLATLATEAGQLGVTQPRDIHAKSQAPQQGMPTPESKLPNAAKSAVNAIGGALKVAMSGGDTDPNIKTAVNSWQAKVGKPSDGPVR